MLNIFKRKTPKEKTALEIAQEQQLIDANNQIKLLEAKITVLMRLNEINESNAKKTIKQPAKLVDRDLQTGKFIKMKTNIYKIKQQLKI